MANCGWPAAGATISWPSTYGRDQIPGGLVRAPCRAQATRRRRAASARWSRAAWRSPASRRSSRRRSPGRRVPRAAPPPPRSGGRAAPPARSRRARRGSRGHASRAILRNFSVSCQYSSKLLGHQIVERVPRHLAGRHVVDQAGKVAGERQRGGRRLGDQRRTASPRMSGDAAHCSTSLVSSSCRSSGRAPAAVRAR